MIFYRTQERRLIENYELAKADNFEGWDLHHRLELTLDGEYALSASDLIRMNMYYDRPYFELIYLRHREHAKLHGHARPVTDNMRKFFREYKHTPVREDVKKRISEKMKGRKFTEEHKAKLREAKRKHKESRS